MSRPPGALFGCYARAAAACTPLLAVPSSGASLVSWSRGFYCSVHKTLLQVGALQQGKLRFGRGRIGACTAESIFASLLPTGGVRPKTPGAWAGREGAGQEEAGRGRSCCQSRARRRRLVGLVGSESAHRLHQSPGEARKIHLRLVVIWGGASGRHLGRARRTLIYRPYLHARDVWCAWVRSECGTGTVGTG